MKKNYLKINVVFNFLNVTLIIIFFTNTFNKCHFKFNINIILFHLFVKLLKFFFIYLLVFLNLCKTTNDNIYFRTEEVYLKINLLNVMKGFKIYLYFIGLIIFYS